MSSSWRANIGDFRGSFGPYLLYRLTCISMIPTRCHYFLSEVIASDFVGPDVEPEEMKQAIRLRRKACFHHFRILVTHSRRPSSISTADCPLTGARQVDVDGD